MKFRSFIILFTVLIILNSCTGRRSREKELENKALIDAGVNELIKEEPPEILRTILTLDDSLLELDQALNGEAGEIAENMEGLNQTLTELQEMMGNLEAGLNSQSKALETLRVETIEVRIKDDSELSVH